MPVRRCLKTKSRRAVRQLVPADPRFAERIPNPSVLYSVDISLPSGRPFEEDLAAFLPGRALDEVCYSDVCVSAGVRVVGDAGNSIAHLLRTWGGLPRTP